MANNRTLTVIVLLSIFVARSHTKDFKEQMFVEGSNVTLWCGNVTKFKWDDLIFVVWNISTKAKKCYIGLSPTPDNTCKDGKRLHNSTIEFYNSLFIPNISMQDEGFYTCDLSYKGGSYSLNISVNVIHLSAYLEPGNKTAVCMARYKNKAPTLHWELASSVLPSNTTFKKSDTSFTIENRVYLDDNFNLSELVCVATNLSMSSSVQLNATQVFSASGYQNSLNRWELIAITMGLFCLILVSLVYVLHRKFNTLSMLKMLCCKSKISPPADDKPPQPADVEEVEPYASYIQRVNSIYNSSAELFNA